MSAREGALPSPRVRVSRSLYYAALHDAIERERGILALHDSLFDGAQACCTPDIRCAAYQQAGRAAGQVRAGTRRPVRWPPRPRARARAGDGVRGARPGRCCGSERLPVRAVR